MHETLLDSHCLDNAEAQECIFALVLCTDVLVKDLMKVHYNSKVAEELILQRGSAWWK